MIKGILFDLNGVLFSYNISGILKFNEENITLVKNLAKKYKLGVVSNAGDEYHKILEEKNVSKFFKVLIFSKNVGFSKPNPEIFNAAIFKMGLKPEEILFIDDSLENVEAGKVLGLKSVLYQSSNQLKEDLVSYGVKI